MSLVFDILIYGWFSLTTSPVKTVLILFLPLFPFGVWYAFYASSNQMEAIPVEYPQISNPVWVRQLQLLMGRFILNC